MVQNHIQLSSLLTKGISMKIKIISLSIALLFSQSVLADDYQLFSNIGYTDQTDSDIDTFFASALIYFDDISARGPLNEFDYLITTSNIAGGYSRSDLPFGDVDVVNVRGEAFLGDFQIGASFVDVDGETESAFLVGYLINPNLLVNVTFLESDFGPDALITGTYQHNLEGNQYLGLTVSTDNKFDNVALESKYFTELSNGRYYSLTADYTFNDVGSDVWLLGGNYYFNKYSSLGLLFNDDVVGVTGSHFFNNNISVSASYLSVSDDFIGDSASVAISYQF